MAVKADKNQLQRLDITSRLDLLYASAGTMSADEIRLRIDALSDELAGYNLRAMYSNKGCTGWR